jgi:hypothetical protein
VHGLRAIRAADAGIPWNIASTAGWPRARFHGLLGLLGLLELFLDPSLFPMWSLPTRPFSTRPFAARPLFATLSHDPTSPECDVKRWSYTSSSAAG